MARKFQRGGEESPVQNYDDAYLDDDLYDEYDEDYEDDEYDDDLARRRASIGCLIMFLAVLGVIAGVLIFAFTYVAGEMGGDKATATETIAIDISPGSGGTTVARQLEEMGLINDSNIFRFYVRFNDASKNFQTGRHYLEPGMSYEEIITTLSEPPTPRNTKMITFPEGSTVMQFASILEKEGLFSADEFLDVINNGDFSDIDFWNNIETDPDTFMRAEGYLAPNTYEFYEDETPENVAARLFEQLDTELTPELYARMEEQGLTLRDTITLASLIEEEAGLPENQPGVAGVFWNRLRGDLSQTDLERRTMGSDVTFFYIRDWIARDYGGSYENVPDNLFYAYYSADDDPRTREGLPVGPISCPSRTAIEAALYPEEHDYFYFLTDYYGNYYYARNFAEHQNNIYTMEQMNAQYEAEEAAGTLEEG